MANASGLTGYGLMAGLFCVMMVAVFALADSNGSSVNTSGGTSGGEIRRGMPLRPDGKSRTQLFFERIAKSVQPDLVGSPDKLALYLAQFKTLALNDPRLIAFDVHADWDAEHSTVVLTGFIEYEEHRASLAEYLKVLGFTHVDDQLQSMPTPDLGDTPYAVVTDQSAFITATPEAHGESLTELKQGDPLFLLRPAGDYYYCHATDGYVGYVKQSRVKRINADELAEAIGQAPTDKIEPAIDAAEKIMGTPYVWGGTTPEGIDCSGLTRYAYEHIGVLLPRDTDQQAAMGKLVATRQCRQAMQRGDLIFFFNSRGRISHTAIYLGDGQFIESGNPGVCISSLDPDHNHYIEKRDQGFAFAKRIIK